MTDAVCKTDPCQVVTPKGVIKYRDNHHLTQTFSRRLADAPDGTSGKVVGTAWPLAIEWSGGARRTLVHLPTTRTCCRWRCDSSTPAGKDMPRRRPRAGG